MQKALKQNQSGAVALITVLFMALLLTVVTTSFIRISINEQRQATDDDLTKRAFFAAESGVEDAKIALDRYLNDPTYDETDLKGDECAEANGLDPQIAQNNDGINSEYTCQLISVVGPSYRSEIPEWTSRSLPLEAVDGVGNPTTFSDMTLSWHEPLDDGNYNLRPAGSDQFPTTTDWGANLYPALIRIQITSYPSTNTFEPNEIRNHVVFVNPEQGGGGGGPYNFRTAANNGGLLRADCDAGAPNGSYACRVTLTNFDDANRNNHIRVTSLYRKTSVEVVLDDGDVDMANASATIDVTGKAGDVFRRIQAVVGLSGEDLLPDGSLTSAEDICKNFFVTDDLAEFVALNPSLDTFNTRLCQ